MERLVIIPTYNEKENIEAIIRAVMELPLEFHILIIDDGSPDGTAAIVKRLMKDEFADRFKAAIPCCAMDPIVPIHQVEEK